MTVRAGVLRAGLSLLVAALAASAAAQAPVEHYWYEGGQRRALRLEPNKLADFEARGRQVIRVVPTTVAKALDAGGATVSPVFRDGPAGDGGARALPGGMLVTLRAPMDDDRARAWFAARALDPIRRIGTTDTWLVRTGPGLASLKAANALHESGEVAGAEPNWWQPRALK